MATVDTCSRRSFVASVGLAASSALFTKAEAAAADDFYSASALPSNDAIDFLYIDSVELSLGDEQNIVISLKDHAGVSIAWLTVIDVESGSSERIQLTKTFDNSLLFRSHVAQTGIQEIARLEFKVDDECLVLDFADTDVSYRSYSVVDSGSTYSRNVESGPELKVYAAGGEEGVSESPSIEEAVGTVMATAGVARSASVNAARSLTIALDPGHVGSDSGATSFGLTEAEANWKIAQYCKAELETYKGVRVVYTVTPDNPVSPSRDLQDRVQRAVDQGANVLVSLHINSSGGQGAEIWAPYNTDYNAETHSVGVKLGEKILAQLSGLGLKNRGVKFRVIEDDTNDPKWDYDGGVSADYYGIIRYARRNNLPAIIVEHAFIDNWSDYDKYLSSDAKLQSLGLADANGIASYFGLAHAEGTVYRLYYAGTKDHHYTMDENEYRVLATRGWEQEGVAWYGAVNWGTGGGGSSVPVTRTPIMGASKASAEQMAIYYRDIVGELTYPSDVYSSYGASQLIDFCAIVLQEAQAEGVRAEVVFAQAMKETGWLRFGGAVKAEQCNFCGLGAVNSAPGNAASFKDVRTGIRAQVQHLKAYASTDPLVQACVDPRFDLVKRGCAPLLEDLNGKWAVPGDGYGESIAKMIDTMLQGGR